MISKFKQELITNSSIRNACSFAYNLIFSKLFLRKRHYLVKRIKGSFCKFRKVSIQTKDFELEIGAYTRLLNCTLHIDSMAGGKLKIGENCRFYNTTFWISEKGSCIEIGDNTSMQGGTLAALEGKRISMGNDCMLSHSIEIRTGDSHGIFKDGERINPAQDINISDHVWIGARAIILKGTNISKGSVVGTCAVVTKSLLKPNSIYVGSPAHIAKENIEWSEKLTLGS